MMRLLYIESSPRQERSHSTAVARAFLDAYAAANPASSVRVIDLWRYPLPRFDGETIAAKYAILHGQRHTAAQQAAWDRVRAIVLEFTAADLHVFSVPMWNFGVPYVLKHYIDVLTQPGLAFTRFPDGRYEGLMTGRSAVVIYASAGTYQPGSERPDLQTPYMEAWLRFIGFTRIDGVRVAPTLGPPGVVAGAREAAVVAARTLAHELAGTRGDERDPQHRITGVDPLSAASA